jgi:hypothetical protein
MINEIIVSREYETPDGKKIAITIGKPTKTAGSDFICPFEVTGLRDQSGQTLGADSVQALVLALERVGTLLYTHPEGKNIRWLGSIPNGDNIGLPVPESIGEIKWPGRFKPS